jgi:hypothetical protein
MRPHGQTKLGFLPPSDSRGQATEELADVSRTILGARSLRRRWRGIHSGAS